LKASRESDLCTTDPQKDEHLRAGGVAVWESACLASARPWV
jgi:hypothetical protein